MKYSSRYSIQTTLVISILLSALLAPGNVQAQFLWEQASDEPVFTRGSTGEWDDNDMYHPLVISDGDTLRMWYSVLYTVSDTQTAAIGYAWSLDGLTWNRHPGNPVLAREPDGVETGPFATAVIKDADTLRMWYADGSGNQWALQFRYATSLDGIHWNRHPDPVFQAGPAGAWDSEILSASVIKEGGTYTMWYSGLVGSPLLLQIGQATSSDGIHWTKYDDPATTETMYAESDPVLKPGPAGNWDAGWTYGQTVLPTATGYEMLYIGKDGSQLVGYASSSDGVAWNKWPENPVIGEFPAWCTAYEAGTVLQSDGLYHFWYTGYGPVQDEFGYAQSLVGLEQAAAEPHYAPPGSDSVIVTAIYTGDAETFQLYAELEAADGTTLDSVQLFDDGAHGDGIAGDSLFGGSIAVPAEEGYYYVGLQARSGDSELINYDGLDWFTTAGPVEYAAYTPTGMVDTIPNPGDTHLFYLSLRNTGSTATVNQVSAAITTDDPCITSITKSTVAFGNIPAGETLSASGMNYYQVAIDTSCPGSSDIPFTLSIATKGDSVWTDEFTVHVYPLGVEADAGLMPMEYALHQNYPNPFNPVSTIQYDIPKTSAVTLVVYDLMGREVARLVDAELTAGYYDVQWDGRDARGRPVPSGIYIARLTTPEYKQSIKMVLLK